MNTRNPSPMLPLLRSVLIVSMVWAATGSASPVIPEQTMVQANENRIDQAPGDCMLPGQIRRLNDQVMIMGARHPIRTTAADCHVRGGEFHAIDPVPAIAAVDQGAPAGAVAGKAIHKPKAARAVKRKHRSRTKPAVTQDKSPTH